MADMARHGRSPVGERNPQARLDTTKVEQMRHLRADTGASFRKIGRMFGVTTMTAYRAFTGQSWR